MQVIRLINNALMIILLSFSFSQLAKADSRPLPAEQAFQFAAQVDNKQQAFNLQWTITPGYHLYRDSVQVKINDKKVRDLKLPAASLRQREKNGSEAVYNGSLQLLVPYNKASHIDTLIVRYQGCSASGFCYPPVTKNYQVDINKSELTLMKTMHDKSSVLNSFITDQSHTKNALIDEKLAVSLLLFFGLGILLAFTPCVLPMVPILVSIIAGQKQRMESVTKKHVFSLCLSYVLGIAVTYALVGVVAAMLGSSIQVWLQKPLFIFFGAFIFVVLGLSLLGLFELYFFKGMQNAIANRTRHLKGGSHIGVFCMGVLSVLLISPCTTAPLIGVLLYIGQTGNILLGATALFVMGMGMGLPLLMVGMSADKWLPRTGAWMEWVKKFLGVMMIGMAIWMVERVGVFSSFGTPVVAHAEQFMPITDLKEFDKRIAASKDLNRPVMLDFYADWCASCVSMEKNVFSNHEVMDILSPFTKLRVNLTANTPMDEMLMKHFDVIAPPTVLFFDNQGKEVNSKRIVGEVDADEFIRRIDTFMTAGCDKNAMC